MNVYIGGPIIVDDYTAMQGPCPDGFHVPLITEWQAIYNAGVSLGAWGSSGGVNFSTYLKIPMAGRRERGDASLYDVGSYGYYWSSSPYSSAGYSRFIYFRASGIFTTDTNFCCIGMSVRCVKDSSTIPTSSWTKLYGTSIESGGIFHNAIDGLISISSDGSTWYTLMDKNLGATTVYNYGDAWSEANCGKYFQWGNNYAFSGDPNYDTSLINKSSTQVDVTGYGPGNYYESSTWITADPRQNSASNGNDLWGGITGNVPV